MKNILLHDNFFKYSEYNLSLPHDQEKKKKKNYFLSNTRTCFVCVGDKCMLFTFQVVCKAGEYPSSRSFSGTQPEFTICFVENHGKPMAEPRIEHAASHLPT